MLRTYCACWIVMVTCLWITTGKPCCKPQKWSANVVDTIGEYNRDVDAASVAYGDRDVFYDYSAHRLAVVEKAHNKTAHTNSHTRTILLYSQGKKYTINIAANNCTMEDITGQEMEPPCIPDDATSFGRHVYPGGVDVEMWFYEDKVRGGTRRLGVTVDTCLPLTLSSLSRGQDYVLRMSVFQNVTVGIPDPSVFTVPSICLHSSSYSAKLLFEPK